MAAASTLIPLSHINKYYTTCIVLRVTSLGFRDIGFSPWASRTWPGVKGERTWAKSGVIKKQTCFPIEPRSLSLFREQGSFPSGITKSMFWNYGKVTVHIWHLPIRSWGTTFSPPPSVPMRGVRGGPSLHLLPQFPSLERRTGRKLGGQNEWETRVSHVTVGFATLNLSKRLSA